MNRLFLLAFVLAGCGGPEPASATGPVVAPRVVVDARRAPDAAPLAPPDGPAAAAPLPRPPMDQLVGEAMMNGHPWIARTYGPPTAAEVAACEAECGRQSHEANAHAARDDLRRLGCAKVSCDHACPVSGVADFRCH
jgi:hypothetical protein